MVDILKLAQGNGEAQKKFDDSPRSLTISSFSLAVNSFS
jgi:hypothetical protein